MSITQEELVLKLKNRFEDLDVDFEEFSKILIKNNAFISGSFLLQVLQNKYYKDSDIDIFTIGKQSDLFEMEISNFLTNVITNKIKKNKLKVIKENTDIRKIFKEESDKKEVRYIETKNLKDWTTCNYINQTTENTEVKIEFCNINNPVKIINHYKNINNVSKHNISVLTDYTFDKINAIVNFESNDVLSKYQLIYYDETKYNTPLDIINCFDLDCCKNYFDGKIFYIDNYDSIFSSCILNLTKPRIYKNVFKRIIKYNERGFNIKAKCNGDIYDIIFLNNSINNPNIIQSKEFNKDMTHLILGCNNACFEITKILQNLPINLEKLIIYTYNIHNIIDNLPCGLQELRLYIWKQFNGMEDDNLNNIGFITDAAKIRYNKIYDQIIETAKDNIKCIPFGCNVYINDEIYEK
jgi:hypothetical protein